MASKLVAFRLPEDLIQAIEAEAEATGKDKTAVVTFGLRQFFGLPVGDPTRNAVANIQQRLEQLERRVDDLTKEMGEFLQSCQEKV